jgi:cytochrome c553
MKTPLLVLALVIAAVPPLAVAVSNADQESSDVFNSQPHPDHGAEVFRPCAVCHGASGGGTPDGQVPRIAGQHFSVLVKQLIDYRHARRWDPLMEYMADKHLLKNAQDIADVAAYASEIQTPSQEGASVGSGEFLARGSELYAQSCMSCHGKSGDGDGGRQIPRVAGQQYAYLYRQIHDAIEGRRPNFSAAHIQLLKGLDYAEITGVADYLSRIPRRPDPDLVFPRHWALNQARTPATPAVPALEGAYGAVRPQE